MLLYGLSIDILLRIIPLFLGVLGSVYIFYFVISIDASIQTRDIGPRIFHNVLLHDDTVLNDGRTVLLYCVVYITLCHKCVSPSEPAIDSVPIAVNFRNGTPRSSFFRYPQNSGEKPSAVFHISYIHVCMCSEKR